MSLIPLYPETYSSPAEYAAGSPVACAKCGSEVDAQDEAYQLEDGRSLCVCGPKGLPCCVTCYICEDALHALAWAPGVERRYELGVTETERGFAHRHCLMEVGNG